MLRGERRTFFRPDTDPEMQQLMAKHQADFAVALDVAMEQSKAIEKAQKEKATMTTKQDEVELTDEHIDVIANSVARHHGCSDHVAKQGVVFAVRNGTLGKILKHPNIVRGILAAESVAKSRAGGDDFEARAHEIRKADPSLSRQEATRKARLEATGDVGKVEHFESTIGSIQKRDGCKRLEAMRKARLEHPAAFAVWNGQAT